MIEMMAAQEQVNRPILRYLAIQLEQSIACIQNDRMIRRADEDADRISRVRVVRAVGSEERDVRHCARAKSRIPSMMKSIMAADNPGYTPNQNERSMMASVAARSPTTR